jgi:ferredoxin
MGTGVCALTAPEVFDQDDDGTVTLLDTAPPRSADAGATRRAADLCPVGAITLVPGDAGTR